MRNLVITKNSASAANTRLNRKPGMQVGLSKYLRMPNTQDKTHDVPSCDVAEQGQTILF